MKETRLIMGMPIEVEIVGATSEAVKAALEEAFTYFTHVDEQFSPYTKTSEVMRLNNGELPKQELSEEMREVLAIGERMKEISRGFFDVHRPDGLLDPSGVVKGWAIRNVADRIRAAGFEHFMVNAGGDIASAGVDAEGKAWSIGVRNPSNFEEIVKVVYPRGKGVATSGSYIRGAHIYNPHAPKEALEDIVSITVVGPDVLAADLAATAAFAMGKRGMAFIEQLPELEGYAIDRSVVATMTSGFSAYTEPPTEG